MQSQDKFILTKYINQQHLSPTTTTTSSQIKGRPLSISSISSAASSGFSSSNNSSASSGIQSLTRHGSLNYGHQYKRLAHLASIESLNSSSASTQASRKIELELKSLKLSPSVQLKGTAASSSSNTSSFFHDDGFDDDDLTSTASECPSSTYQRHHRLSSNTSCTLPKQTKCDDRTVSIIGHMPTRSPGYWDSNLSITQRVVTEIIETERTYVEDLEQIVTGYICHLRNILKRHRRHQSRGAKNRFHKQSLEYGRQQSTTTGCIDEDDKSMLSFDADHLTSATNVDGEFSAEETGHDVAPKENTSPVSERDSSNTESEDNDAIISDSNIKKLFSNLEDIYKFNKDLLFRLEECYSNPSSVAECFVENSAGFEVYTHYCTMYPQVVSTLTELMSNHSSAQLLRERQNELNQSLPLGAYLLKPVQRILKYHILFQSLIKHTSEDDSVSEKDRQSISEAFSVMTSIACHINAMKRRHENAIRVQEIQGLLSDWEGPDLTTFGELILEDTFKLFNQPKSSRHIFLFDNVLLITKKKREGSFCYKGHMTCSNIMLIENIDGHPLVFNTVPFDNPKALCAFQAKTLDKKRDWCLHIKDMIIKSFEVKIPDHVRDILMSLTTSSSTESSPSSRACRAPNYLERKKSKQEKR